MFKKHYSDDEIVDMVKAGGANENVAIRVLMNRNRNKITRMVLQHHGLEEDAKDVFQEGIVELLFIIAKGKYNKKSALDTFLYRICKFIWYKKYHQKMREKKASENITLEMEKTPDVMVIHNEWKAVLQQLSAHVGADCVQLFYMSAMNYSSEEIVKKMPRLNSAQAVMNKKYKCKKKLGELLETNSEASMIIKELKRHLTEA